MFIIRINDNFNTYYYVSAQKEDDKAKMDCWEYHNLLGKPVYFEDVKSCKIDFEDWLFPLTPSGIALMALESCNYK